jgi:hypothetical protein
MTVNASGNNQLKPVQYIKPPLRIPPVLYMVTSGLTDNRWTTRFHSPSPQFTLSVPAQITLMEESSIWRENIFSVNGRGVHPRKIQTGRESRKRNPNGCTLSKYTLRVPKLYSP